MYLRHLLQEAGGSRREAARRAGVGRSTLYRWLEEGLLDVPLETLRARYGPRPPRPSKLAPYHPLIHARLAEFPALQATRLFAECRAAGYPGGYSQLRAYVGTLRPASAPSCVSRLRPASRPKSTSRTAAFLGASATR
ncbi:MAG: helix-turn-helix domain-containing protein [Gemmatimonadetes bacterium]|nr:helix-turn-helix domain-containing protein [Gemmatimonadota bacterium]